MYLFIYFVKIFIYSGESATSVHIINWYILHLSHVQCIISIGRGYKYTLTEISWVKNVAGAGIQAHNLLTWNLRTCCLISKSAPLWRLSFFEASSMICLVNCIFFCAIMNQNQGLNMREWERECVCECMREWERERERERERQDKSFAYRVISFTLQLCFFIWWLSRREIKMATSFGEVSDVTGFFTDRDLTVYRFT